MRFILLNADQVATLNTYPSPGARIEPRLIDAGQYAGYYGVPARVLLDPAQAANVPALKMLPEVSLETDQAWPPPPDDGA